MFVKETLTATKNMAGDLLQEMVDTVVVVVVLVVVTDIDT